MSVTTEKICTFRKSRKFPNVYLRKELENLAREEGYSLNNIKSLSKIDLCGLLGIDWYVASSFPDAPRQSIKVRPMTKKKVCGARKSKRLPNVYTRAELEKIAKKRGYTAKEIKELNKMKLCGLLGIDWYVTSLPKKSVKPPSDEGVIFYKKRPCNVRRSVHRPDAYLKNELVDIVSKKHKITKTKARKLTKNKLCDLLNGDLSILDDVPKTPKDELIDLVSEKYDMSTASLQKRTVADLKKMLISDVTITPLSLKRTSKDELIKKVAKKYKMSKSRLKDKTVTELKKMLDADIKIIERETKPTEDCIERSKIKLDPHQEDLVRYLQKNHGAIAVHSTGAGKTLSAVAASQCVLDANPDWEILVVTPKSLQENFKKEMVKYGADPKDDRYIFYTHAGFRNAYRDKKQKCNSKTFLIIDEAHRMRTDILKSRMTHAGNYSKAMQQYRMGMKTKRPVMGMSESMASLECAHRAGKILLLTATVIYNRPYDVENLVAMIKGTQPLTEKEFNLLVERAAYARSMFDNHFDCVFSFYDRPKSEAYPDFEEHIIKITMTPEYYKEYRKVENQKSLEFDRKTNPMAFLGGVRQATNSLDPPQKVDWIMKKIKRNMDKKIVIYSAFKTRGVNIVKNRLDDIEVKYTEVTGDIKSIKARAEAVEDFNSPSGPNILFITKAGGEGLDLKGVRIVIILEATWNRANELQVIGRAVRKYSHAHLPLDQRTVDIYHLVLVKPEKRDYGDIHSSADERLRSIVGAKTDVNTEFENLIRELDIAREACGKN